MTSYPPAFQGAMYDQAEMTIVQPIEKFDFHTVAANPGATRTLWQRSADGHMMRGAVDLEDTGAAPDPETGLITGVDFANIAFANTAPGVGTVPVSYHLRKIRSSDGFDIVHLVIDESIGAKSAGQAYVGPAGAIPVGFRQLDGSRSLLTFNAVTDGSAAPVYHYDSDITGHVFIDHTTGNIEIWREGLPGATAWNAVSAASAGWHTMSTSWITDFPPP